MKKRPCHPEHTIPTAIRAPWMRNWILDYNELQNTLKQNKKGRE